MCTSDRIYYEMVDSEGVNNFTSNQDVTLSFSLFDTMADSFGDKMGFVVMGSLVCVPVIEYIMKWLMSFS